MESVLAVSGTSETFESIRRDMPDDLGLPVEYRNLGEYHAIACAASSAGTIPGDNRCDRPLRGGVYMEGCTAGFIATGRSSGNPYVLTAGHCVAEPYRNDGNKSAWNSNHVAHPIGPGQNTSFYHGPSNAKFGDAGIVRVDYDANTNGQWGSLRPWVLVRAGGCSDGGCLATGSDGEYYINGQPQLLDTLRDRVCSTGTTSGLTWCGIVEDLGYEAIYYMPGVDGYTSHRVKGLSTTNICNRSGDSGGPVFVAHSAYGLQSGGYDVLCSMTYYPIQYAEHDMNFDVKFGTKWST